MCPWRRSIKYCNWDWRK